jgi:copper homeostasis protein (lipoprotein)
MDETGRDRTTQRPASADAPPAALLAAGLLVLLTAACGPAEPPPEPAPGPGVAAPAPAPAPAAPDEGATEAVAVAGITLPASFMGVLPCADCEGIDTTLTLDAGFRYRLRSRYVGKPAGQDTFVEAGRFAVSDAGTRLALYGPTAGTVIFAVQGPDQLTRLDTSGEPIASQLNYTLRRAPALDPIPEPGRTTGLFTYLADAASFVDCHTGERLPVAMRDGYLPLEQAYTASTPGSGEPRLVRLLGHVELAVGMEESRGPQPTLVVDKFEELVSGETRCRRAQVPLEGTRWVLTRLGDAAIPASADAVADLILDPAGERLGGSTGCSRLSGGYDYSVASGALTVGSITTTGEACPAGGVDGAAYTQALQRATQATVTGEVLVLRDGESEIATFQAE